VTDSLPNVPVPDELAAVRSEIKRLAERENALKAILLNEPDTRTGNAYAVEVKEIETTRVDLKELRAMHEALVAEYTFPQKTIRLELRSISDDGELTPLRKHQKQR
jgi:hypothetical protein